MIDSNDVLWNQNQINPDKKHLVRKCLLLFMGMYYLTKPNGSKYTRKSYLTLRIYVLYTCYSSETTLEGF